MPIMIIKHLVLTVWLIVSSGLSIFAQDLRDSLTTSGIVAYFPNDTAYANATRACKFSLYAAFIIFSEVYADSQPAV
jgi:hypothetical protein